MIGSKLSCIWKGLLCSFFCVFFLSVFSFAQNAIVTENALPGNPYSEWGVPDFRDNRIAGFATKMSLNRGETVRFKINVQSGASYTLKIYRIGYYGGNGARLIINLGTLSGTVQPGGISNSSTGHFDCSNWSESASWAIPSSATSGFYIAKLERSGGGSNHIAFIVRNDASNSHIYFQFPDATWQAYNGYGGNSMYDGSTSFPAGHAVKVSYNRPFFPYNSLFNTDGREADWYMNAEYPMIRWLERNGYDVTYTSCNDVAKNGSRLLNHNIFLTIGHDEYWSKEHRNNVEAARNAGVHLAFFTGNEVYWKTRWENNDGTEDRTLVCYKEGFLGDGSLGERSCGYKCDPSAEWTGLWRTGGSYDAGKPENGLVGQISWVEYPSQIGVPSFYKNLRFWRNTSVANLSSGQTASLGVNTLGYEWDYEQPEYASSNPHGRITMSSATISGKTHKLSLYRHSSGALVFGAGTVQWSWGLDGNHWGGSTTISAEMQQATVNLFADMGVQPGTLQSGLTAASQSTDVTAPTTSITSPSNGATFSSGATISFSGNANDGGGGVVASVEISVDGGNTWTPATVNNIAASTSWSHSWTAGSNGTYTIRARGVDDSGNIGNATSITITVGTGGDVTPPTVSSVSPANNATGVSTATTVSAIFSESVNSSTVTTSTFQLRDAGNNLITASVSTSGNQITLTPSSALTASTTYTATIIGGASGVKDLSGNALVNNYSWSFSTVLGDITPPTVTSVSPVSGATGINIYTNVTANFNEAINASTVTGSTFQLRDGGNNLVSATVVTSSSQITLTPTAILTTSTTYTVTIVGGASGVKDLAGNALANNYSWSFTTGTETSPPPVTIQSFSTKTGTAATVHSLTGVPAGALLVLATTADAVPSDCSVSSSPSLTWTKRVDAGATQSDNGEIWTAVYSAGGSITVTGNWGQESQASVCYVVLYAEPTLGGAFGTAVSQSAPSVTITTTRGNSIIFGCTADWKAINGSTRTLRDAATERLYFKDGNYTTYYYTKTAAAIAAYTEGVSLPTGQQASTALLEIRSIAPAAIPPTVTTQPISQTRCAGANAIFSSAASGNPAPTVQWQESSNGTIWINITDATAGTLSFVTATADNNKQYRAVWTNSAGTVNSNAATLTVNSTPTAPVVGVVNNCGNSVLTASGFTGTILWSTGATTPSITVTTAATYTVMQTVNGCVSAAASGIAAPNATPPAPTVATVNNCGNSVLTASGFTGTLLWSNGETTASITVTTGGTYTVTQTINGCTSAPGSGTASPITPPPAPSVAVVNNCGNSVLTASGFTGTLLWSMGATTPSITVANAGTYSVTQTVNGCPSAPGSGIAAPKTIPAAPAVNVTNNCGSSTLTASNITGSLLWSNGAITSSITVTIEGTYTVTQTVNGCASAAGSGTASPNTTPTAPSVAVVNNCGNSVLTASGFTGTLLWSNGETTASITIITGGTYTVTQTINGCTSGAGSGLAQPVNSNVATPTITVEDDCGFSVLTASGFTGTLLWSTGATTPSITVANAGTYSVTQTVNGCPSAPGSGIAAPKTIPAAPSVGIANNCETSTLTASNITGSLLWSNGAITSSITVTIAGTYTVTQTVNGCASAAGSGTASPNTTPTAPSVAVVNNCGNSVLTASGFTGSLLWSNGATSSSITVTTAGTYSVTQTVNGCISAHGSGTAAPLNSVVDPPTITVVDNCTNSILTAGSFTGTLLWSNGETSPSITVSIPGTYTVTQTVNGCTSPATSGIATPLNFTIAVPTVTVLNSCGNSVLTAGSFTGSLLWSNGATTPDITVVSAGTYTVTQTVNGCSSGAGAGVATPKTIPTAPNVTVIDNCGSSVLIASGFTGALLWSNGATTESITVNTAGTYTVTQTVNGCTSVEASSVAAPKAIPPTPTVSVVDNCGNSTLTAGSFTGSLLWSNAATTATITVNTAATYTVTQSINGCTSAAGSGVAAPKAVPALSSNMTTTVVSGTTFTYIASSATAGTTFAWSRAAVTGISNAAASGTGNINETLVNTLSTAVNVIYVYTLTANGCTNTQNVVVGVSSVPIVTTVSPVNGTVGVSISSTIIANFSEALNGTTVTPATFQLKDAGNNIIPASISTSSNQITLAPSALLSNSTVYTVTIKGGATGVKGLVGNAMINDYNWSFTTGTETPPSPVTIQSFDPKMGTAATTHSLSGVPGGALLVLATTGDAFPSDCIVSSTPSLTWTKRVDAGAAQSDNAEIWTAVYAAGGSITVTSNWGAHSQASICYVVLNAEPTLGGASATDVLQTAPSVTINTTRNNSIIFGCTADWKAVDGTSRTLRDGAAERLYFKDGHYTAYHYTKAATSIAAYTEGISLPTGQQASTALLEIRGSAGAADITPPTVSAISPANGATGVSINTTVTANFNEAINASTVTGSTFQLRDAGGNLVSATVNTSSNQIVLTPTASLATSATYTVTIVGGASGVKDLAGNALVTNYNWSFTTGTSQPVTIQTFSTKTGTAATSHPLTGVPAGALLVLATTADAVPSNCIVSSSPALTWTKRSDAGAASSDNAEIWTAVYSAGGSITVTSNWGTNNSQSSVCYVVLNAEPNLGGASATAVLQAAPSVTITTTRDNSIIFGCTADWRAVNGASRTLRDAATERLYFRDGHYTTYHYTKAAALVAAYTEGVSLPTGQQASTALLEIRGAGTATRPANSSITAITTINTPDSKVYTHSLGQNYPNPFNKVTNIPFALSKAEKVNIQLLDISGRVVKVLVNGSKDVGTHTVSFNAGSLAKGVYYYKIQAGNFTSVNKLIIW